jgi:hypothetical protein
VRGTFGPIAYRCPADPAVGSPGDIVVTYTRPPATAGDATIGSGFVALPIRSSSMMSAPVAVGRRM